MTDREQYTPGPASGAQVRKDGEKWTLILVRELRHPPEKVWQALTDPAHLREWAPFEADGSLGTVGATVNLTWVGTPTPQVTETTVTRADAPKVLEYGDIRWELEALGGGTRLTLWHNIDRRFISWGAAGWHICFDVLDRLLSGTPIGRIAGGDAMKFGGWQRLNAEYAKQFGIEAPGWPPTPEALKRRRKNSWNRRCRIRPSLPKTAPKARAIVFWIVTALFCLQMSFTAYAQLRLPQGAEAFTHLGFPGLLPGGALVGQAARRGAAACSGCRRGSKNGPTPASPSTSSRRSSPTSRWAMARWRGSGDCHRRALGALVLLLAPPAGHGGKRLTAHRRLFRPQECEGRFNVGRLLKSGSWR